MKDSGWQLWHVYRSDEKFWYRRQSGRTAGYQTFAPLLTVYLPGSRGLSFECSLHRIGVTALQHLTKAPEVEAEAARLREARRAANLASDAAAKAASAGSRKRRAR